MRGRGQTNSDFRSAKAPAQRNAPVGHAPAPSTVRQAHLFVWDEAKVIFLSVMWPHVRAAKIAEKLGCSRDAVIGKAHHLNLPCIKKQERRRRNAEGTKESFDRGFREEWGACR